MKIGLDIDNVITDFDKAILEEFLIADKAKRNAGIINSEARHIINEMFDWSEEEVNQFFADNMEEIAKRLEPRENAKENIDKLLDEGNQIYLISHRAYPHYSNPVMVTKQWLADNDIKYTKLIISESTNKSKECLEYGIEVFFDDVVSNCVKLEESGINCFLMETRYNKNQEKIAKVVKDFNDLYNKIGELKMKKENIILDTDMENEIDDQFALVYLLNSLDKFNLKAITIAPFSKSGYSSSKNIEEGTDKSYDTTLRISDMMNYDYKNIVYKGATSYLNDSQDSNLAVEAIIKTSLENDNVTILAIGAITNIALAILKEPKIISKIKVIWLGGNSFLTKDNSEFNFRQDIKAVQTVFESKVNLTVIPCRNVASNLTTTSYELEHYIKDKGELGEYLCDIFLKCKKSFMKEEKDEIGSSKTLWDLSAIGYLINKEWFKEEEISCPKVLEDGNYEMTENRHKVTFISDLFRNKIYQDFFIKMGYRK